MREIKFRAWDADKKEMYTPKMLQFIVEDTPYIKKGFWATHPITGMMTQEVMQFTGLYDKNGVEIWENDIVKVQTEKNGQAEILAVEWEADGCCFRCHAPEVSWVPRIETSHFLIFEVIGNIHQTPELLEAQ